MRSISVRPLLPEDCVEGAVVYAGAHDDYVKQFALTKVKPHEGDDWYLSFHGKGEFRQEWGANFVRVHANGRHHSTVMGELSIHDHEAKVARAIEENGPIKYVLSHPWWVESDSYDDADEDDYVIRKLIEAEGVAVTMTVFVPNDCIGIDDHEMAMARAKDLVENGFRDGVLAAGIEIESEMTTASLVSEEHLHLFDEDGIMIADDVRSYRMFRGGINQTVVSALGCPAPRAQKIVIDSMVERAQQRMREAEMYQGRGGRGRGVRR